MFPDWPALGFTPLGRRIQSCYFHNLFLKINFQTLDEKILEEKLNIDEKKEYYFNDLATESGYRELEYYEVIGNIYDNPELLEEGE